MLRPPLMDNQDLQVDEERRAFIEGVNYFNRAKWFEAHEVWEDAWNLSDGRRKKFYQALIQLAVTLEHIKRGNPRGVVKVYDRALAKIADLPEVFQGVKLHELSKAIGAMVDRVRAMPPDAFDPSRERGVDMPVSSDEAPWIEWEHRK